VNFPTDEQQMMYDYAMKVIEYVNNNPQNSDIKNQLNYAHELLDIVYQYKTLKQRQQDDIIGTLMQEIEYAQKTTV
jgi:hypothetical protein